MQNGGMPQFGSQGNNQSSRMNSRAVQVGNSQPHPQQNSFGSAILDSTKTSTLTNLKKEQILPALVAIFGFLALIFMVSTIALAVTRPSDDSGTGQNTGTPAQSATAETMGFFIDKISNPTENVTYRYGTSIRNAEDHQVLAVYTNDSYKGITMDVNWEFVAGYYNVNSTRVDQESFKMIKNKEVADLMIGRASNDRVDDVLLVLLADGTVWYMPIRQSLEKYSFEIVDKITDVENAVKFYKASETVNGEALETVMVQQANGQIIDLRQQLLKAVGKDIK